MKQNWQIYLSGEIHSNWRSEIQGECEKRGLAINFVGPELDHATSDHCGEKILGPEESLFWKDHKAAKINAVRFKKHIKNCDILVVRFGEKYRQWNAAFDAGQAVALGIPVVSFHEEGLDHALKEVDASAQAVARNVEQVVDLIEYVMG